MGPLVPEATTLPTVPPSESIVYDKMGAIDNKPSRKNDDG